MNCQRFEDLIVDMVREHGLEDSIRFQVLAHADSCPACSARLASQQALSAAIKLAAAEGGEAPAHIEEALLSAYRLRQAGRPRLVAAPRALRNFHVSYWGVAAAMLVALLGVATYRVLHNSRPVQVAGSSSGQSTLEPSQPAKIELVPAATVTRETPMLVAAKTNAAAKKAEPPMPAAKARPEEVEVATDFFPLTSGNELNMMESGQLVRVLLPRNAMASYGLPVNQERIDKPVTAQVLIGQDGVARAIRFLSEQNTNFVQTGMRSKR
jgi:hypothetical protein